MHCSILNRYETFEQRISVVWHLVWKKKSTKVSSAILRVLSSFFSPSIPFFSTETTLLVSWKLPKRWRWYYRRVLNQAWWPLPTDESIPFRRSTTRIGFSHLKSVQSEPHPLCVCVCVCPAERKIRTDSRTVNGQVVEFTSKLLLSFNAAFM